MHETIENMRLFTYRMTHDTGFAPNPFYDILTLATCKPGIRRTKKVGDWVAGFSSSELNQLANGINVKIDPDALIWIGKVSEVLPMEKYYFDPRFNNKIPSSNDKISSLGDNIYKYNNGNYKQIPNNHHGKEELQYDISGINVLIFKEYYYLGQKGIPIPKNFNILIPKGSTPYGVKNINQKNIEELINWIKFKSKFKQGINGNPCLWNEINNKRSSCKMKYNKCIK